MATILWSEAGRMRHYIEKSLAFGQKKSSNYAQRWANAVITIMWSRFDAEERKLFDAETDPERRAVINQRDALSTLTGRNEMRCAAAHVYTDDTIGEGGDPQRTVQARAEPTHPWGSSSLAARCRRARSRA